MAQTTWIGAKICVLGGLVDTIHVGSWSLGPKPPLNLTIKGKFTVKSKIMHE